MSETNENEGAAQADEAQEETVPEFDAIAFAAEKFGAMAPKSLQGMTVGQALKFRDAAVAEAHDRASGEFKALVAKFDARNKSVAERQRKALEKAGKKASEAAEKVKRAFDIALSGL